MTNTIKNLISDNHANYILPFFWQHGEDEATLRDYMKAINEANIGAVCIESRPHPDFAGEKWWKDMDVILDEARKRNMKVWILDDSHFPTGFANGAMANEPLSKARRSICCQKIVFSANDTFSQTAKELVHPLPKKLSPTESMIAQYTGQSIEPVDPAIFTDDTLIGISAVLADGTRLDLKNKIDTDGNLSFSSDQPFVVYKMNQTRNRGPHPEYINMLDKDSVKVLIDTVYETHYDHYKDDFGKTIEGFFSDEPELGNGHLYELHHELGQGFDMDYPFSFELLEILKEKLGDNLASGLPLIWENENSEDAAKVRYIYMDAVTRLVEKNFSYQVGDWCRSHKVKYIGHIIEDNGQHCRTGSTLGHYFRALKGQSWAGIDDIGGQVYPMGENDSYEYSTYQVRNGNFYHFMLGKLANSLAALDAKKAGNSMCEIFGNYGWEEGLRLEKYLADHFMVRGINHFVPHAFSAKAFPDPDCPPHFYAHGHNPEYKHFGQIMKYMNRVCELISDGYHVSPVGIIYHGEAEWTGDKMPDEEIARILAEGQIDYDFIPMDAFSLKDDYNATIENNQLVINTQRYRAIVVPYMQFISQSLRNALINLQEKGILVYFAGGKPEGLFDGDKAAFDKIPVADKSELISKLSGILDISISPADTFVRYYHYVKADGTIIYLLVNENEKEYNGSLSFHNMQRGTIFQYDAWNNRISAVSKKDDTIPVNLKPLESTILIFTADPTDIKLLSDVSVPPLIIDRDAPVVELSPNWRRSICRSINYPAFEESKEVILPDCLATEKPEFSGWIKYENTFNAAEKGNYSLEITDAFEGVEVYVNNRNLGLQISAPYIFDISDAVDIGENHIRIEVATTLERAMQNIPDPYGRPKPVPEIGSGITGIVTIRH